MPGGGTSRSSCPAVSWSVVGFAAGDGDRDEHQCLWGAAGVGSLNVHLNRHHVMPWRPEPGQILVTRSTDPGWTPLFSIVSGLVLEIGGQLSHGAIVAREYGLPAVVNVPEATSRIAEGQMIVVDGSAGEVFLEDGEHRHGGEEGKSST